MTIHRWLLCGVWALLLGGRAMAGDLTGQWAGLAPDGLLFAPGSGFCNADLVLELDDTAGVISGTVRTVAQIVTNGCLTRPLSSREVVTGQILPSRLTGTVGAGTLSFNIVFANFRNGVPLSFSAVVAAGTFTTDRLATTGTFIPTRAWADVNADRIPNCNLLTPTANGECGPLTNPQTAPITLAATSGPDLVDGVTFGGDVTVLAGHNFICLNGGITGNVTVKGGGMVLNNCAVGGNVQISGGGTFSLGPAVSVGGNLVAQKIPSAPTANQICDTSVENDLQFHDNGTSVQIGSPGTSCRGNRVGNNLDVHNNTAVAAIYNNVVGNDLKVNNNSGAPQVFSNVITGNLQCAGNIAQPPNSITGGGNTAKSKQGQCAGF